MQGLPGGRSMLRNSIDSPGYEGLVDGPKYASERPFPAHNPRAHLLAPPCRR